MGFTPLLAAIRYINPECVHLLLARGAGIMVKDKHRQLNALLWAVEIQSPEILKVKENKTKKYKQNKKKKEKNQYSQLLRFVVTFGTCIVIIQSLFDHRCW